MTKTTESEVHISALQFLLDVSVVSCHLWSYLIFKIQVNFFQNSKLLNLDLIKKLNSQLI